MKNIREASNINQERGWGDHLLEEERVRIEFCPEDYAFLLGEEGVIIEFRQEDYDLASSHPYEEASTLTYYPLVPNLVVAPTHGSNPSIYNYNDL